MLLCQTRLLLGFTHHYIDFGYFNSIIFIFFGWFMSKQSLYINILNSFKHKRLLTTRANRRPKSNAMFCKGEGVNHVKSQLFTFLEIKCTSKHDNKHFIIIILLLILYTL